MVMLKWIIVTVVNWDVEDNGHNDYDDVNRNDNEDGDDSFSNNNDGNKHNYEPEWLIGE